MRISKKQHNTLEIEKTVSQSRNGRYKEDPMGNFRPKNDKQNKKLTGWIQQQNGHDKEKSQVNLIAGEQRQSSLNRQHRNQGRGAETQRPEEQWQKLWVQVTGPAKENANAG